MRGLIGGLLTGGLVSVVGLGAVSVISEQPAGVTPPSAPLVEAPAVAEAAPAVDTDTTDSPNTPVGAMSIDAPVVPDLPEGEGGPAVSAPVDVDTDANAPRADTDPLEVPDVVSVEGAMEAPQTPDVSGLVSEPLDPVFPNPQSQAPQTPEREADLTVSTVPDQPVVVVVPESEDAAVVVEDSGDLFVVDLGADAAEITPEAAEVAEVAPIGDDAAAPEGVAAPQSDDATQDAPAAQDSEDVVAVLTPDAEAPDSDPAIAPVATPQEPAVAPRVQLQGGENTLLTPRDTGVTVRRPSSETVEDTAPAINALELYAAENPATDGKPLMSVVLIDDGSMSAAAAALSGLPFPVTIAIDPALPDAAALMAAYRSDGFEVLALAKVPEGAVPSDVEITLESVFGTLPETIGVLDIGDGGLQSDRDVTEQAMAILASQGRGFITVSQGLNMAGRAADAAGVPAAVVYRDLDIDGQDARVVRRFVDQAAFRARQESGVVLVGRVRPDTISALILWGTANQDEQVDLVPVSAVLNAQ